MRGGLQKARQRLEVELLEERLVLSIDTYTVDLNPTGDRFGNQIVTAQAYQDRAHAAFGIFDTGASGVTFSAKEQDHFTSQGIPIPIKVPGGAVAQGVGGLVRGDVSRAAPILVTGLHGVTLGFDAAGNATFGVQFDATSASVPGVQTFVGTASGSPHVQTISGTPILNGSPGHALAALVDMLGATLDFSAVIPGLVVTLPDLSFVQPGTNLSAGDDTSPVQQIPLLLAGPDNHTAPGSTITESPNPVQPSVTVVNGTATAIGQRFLFDTGAQLSAITPALAVSLGLDLAHPSIVVTIEGAGGSEQVSGFVIDEIDLPRTDGGTLRFTHVPVFVMDLAGGLGGVLGMNLFNSASHLLYDPFGPGGPTASFTFFTDSGRGGGDRGDGGTSTTLGTLGVPFSGSIDGDSVPALDSNVGSVRGHAFIDYNQNGARDTTEPGLTGATVYLDTNNNGALDPNERSILTLKDGAYDFEGLAPGSYTVREQPPSGFVLTSPANGYVSVIVQPGATIDEVDFGNFPTQSGGGSDGGSGGTGGSDGGSGGSTGGGDTGGGTTGGGMPKGTGPLVFLTGLYGSVFDRAPDAAGLSNWLAALQRGITHDQVARAFWESAEHRGLQVDQFYQQILHRPADTGGRTYWVNLFLAGATENDIQLRFLQSPENLGRLAAASDFVADVYHLVLGRTADAAGLAAWGRALEGGLSRADLVRLFATSDEAYGRAVDQFYRSFLHRAADPAGRQSWVAFLKLSRGPLDTVAEQFLSSAEFLNWYSQFAAR